MNYIKLASNQRLVKIDKAASNKTNPYAIFNLSALQRAMSLKPNTFKLWCYLNANQHGYEMPFAREKYLEWAGVTKNTYLAAWKDLIDKGYIIHVDEIRPGIEGWVFLEDGCSSE